MECWMQKEFRLTKREDFRKVFAHGKSVANRQFVVYFLHNKGLERFRVGLSVSKKIGNAVVRNRVKRYLREVIRLNQDQITSGWDFIIIARNPTSEMDYGDFKNNLQHALKIARLFKGKNKIGE